MKNKIGLLLLVVCLVSIFNVSSFAQNNRNTAPAVEAQIQDNGINPNSQNAQNLTEILVNEIVQLRKSLQSVNTRLREINEKLAGTDLKQNSEVTEKQRRIVNNLEILTRAEQRAETLRKQLIELVEKENSLKSRLAQLEEDIRPENIERTINVIGTTRAPELRETRRKTVENERNGLRSLVYQTEQSRQRLENDVQQADYLVFKLRQQALPAIEKEIPNINPN